MPTEDFVSYSILKFLLAEHWVILQYHPPGGGAAFPVHTTAGQVIYPDITATKKSDLLVLENKARFNRDDIEKLLRLHADDAACACIRNYARAKGIAKERRNNQDLNIRVGHGFSGRIRDALTDVELFHVDASGAVKHITTAAKKRSEG